MDSKKLSLGKGVVKEALSNKALSKYMSKDGLSNKSTTVERKSVSFTGDNNASSNVSSKNELGLTKQEEINRINALYKFQKSQKAQVTLSQSEKPLIVKGARIFQKNSDTGYKVKEDKIKILEVPPLEPVEAKTVIIKKEVIFTDSDKQDTSTNTNTNASTYTNTYKKKEVKTYRKIDNTRQNRQRKKVVNLKKGKEIVINQKLITLRELSEYLSETKKTIFRTIRSLGEECDENTLLKKDLVELIAMELNHNIVYKLSSVALPSDAENETADIKNLKERPPVVTIMGHIDHGKTTLLDAFRNSNIAKSESSGITQHIGAYQMKTKAGKSITFIDTPGHAAFTAMRMRGAKVTDIVIIVVAADDGVNEQTVEAIKHAKAAEVPIIVAINKIDKNNANPQKVMKDLLQHGIIVEDMGGDVMSVNISAKEKINLDKLEEAILLQAEFLELKYDPTKKARGVVIESKLDKKCGAFATLLVQNGTLDSGDTIVVGESCGKLKGMVDSYNNRIKSATGGMPVEILGLNVAPAPGTEFFVVKNEKEAKSIIDSQLRDRDQDSDIVKREFENEKGKLNFIIKADVTGSIEAITESIKLLENEEVEIKVVHTAVGDINESDILLSKVSNAYIIGFRVKAEKKIKDNDKIIFHSVIYGVIESIKDIIKKMLAPEFEEIHLGTAKIKEVFALSDKKSQIAGCSVTDGVIHKSSKVRLLRNSEVIKETSIKSLRKFKEEVKEVKTGYECGILLSDFNDIKVGDIIEAFEIK
jgi:translation initiation factor IF-2